MSIARTNTHKIIKNGKFISDFSHKLRHTIADENGT
jgi:hypothetical protein